MVASRGHHVGVLRYLLECGAHVTGVTPDGTTALMLALDNKSTDPGVQETDKALEEETSETLDETLDLLLQHGADTSLSAADRCGRNGLYLAVKGLLKDRDTSTSSKPPEDTLRKLLEAIPTEKLPSIIHNKDEDGNTALTLALDNQPIRDLLIEFGGYDVRELTSNIKYKHTVYVHCSKKTQFLFFFPITVQIALKKNFT